MWCQLGLLKFETPISNPLCRQRQPGASDGGVGGESAVGGGRGETSRGGVSLEH